LISSKKYTASRDSGTCSACGKGHAIKMMGSSTDWGRSDIGFPAQADEVVQLLYTNVMELE